MYAHELFEQNKPRVVVTYPGRFQPFHQGHAGVFSQLQKKFGAENVFIATSNDQSSTKSPFNFSDKYQLMAAAGVPADKIIQTNAMYALPEGIDPYNTIFITAVGAPDADRLNPDTVLKRDKKDKAGNIVKPAGSPGYYKKWDPSRDPVSADQHGYVIVIPEIKKSIKIGGQTYDVSHGTETRNLWNAVRDDEKSRLEFLSQLYGRPSSELANIFDKIPQTAKEDIAPGSSDSTSPIHGGQIYEQVVAEDLNEDAMMGKIEDSGKIVRILKKQHSVPFSDEKNWLLIDTDPAKGNKGLGIKWIPANTRFEWVRPYRDTAEQTVAEGWSQKYKKSINCSHPKGFSQKAHCAGKRKHNESVETEMVCEDCGMCETHGDHSQNNLSEACWKGYHKDGMKTMFGKRYPNCVKNKNESLETYIRKGECPGCGNRMVAESQLNEKQDACYHKVKSRYKVWPSAYASGALVQCRKKGAPNWGNKSESITQEEYDQLDENLKKWFSDKWVRFGPDGKIRGDCARGDSSEGKPKCLPQSKAHSLGKKGRASAAAKKRREDPNPERRGSAINVATKTKSNEDASGVIATKKQARDPRYSMSLTKDVRPGQIEKNLRAFKLAEQADNNNLMFELFAKFLPLAMRDLGLTMLPKIVPELRIESTDGQASFGRFVDGEMTIQLAMANRHPVDILRTLAHELVHYKQKTLGKIKHDSGETGSPEENQANTIAGIIMRHFNKEYPDAVNMQPIDLNESKVTVNYGIGKNPGRLVKVGADGRVPHAKLHVNVNKKTAKKLGIPHLNENGDDEADEVKKQKNLIPFPKGTVKIDVSDVYDWYKLGMEISDLDDADPADFGKGPPQTVMAFGDEEQEHKYLPQLKRLGLKTHDIDEAAQKCPPATQNIELNLGNRQKAIDETGYGPLNPDMPNRKFWMRKAEMWQLDSIDEAKQSLCGNCAAFDITKKTLDCIAQGIGTDGGSEDPQQVIDAGELGYCRFLKFKCASRRTCDAWVVGGPIVDKPVDENFAGETKKFKNVNEGVADVAKAAAYFIPGVGPAMAAYDVYNAAKTGSAKDVASSLVGFIPGAKGLAAARAINVGKAAYDYQQATADINKPKNTATALAPIQPKDNEFEPIDSTPKNTTAPLAPIQPKDNEIGTVDENFADGRNPGDKGSLKAKVKGKVTMAKARAILKNKNSTPRAKQLAHWFINMNKGRNK